MVIVSNTGLYVIHGYTWLYTVIVGYTWLNMIIIIVGYTWLY